MHVCLLDCLFKWQGSYQLGLWFLIHHLVVFALYSTQDRLMTKRSTWLTDSSHVDVSKAFQDSWQGPVYLCTFLWLFSHFCSNNKTFGLVKLFTRSKAGCQLRGSSPDSGTASRNSELPTQLPKLRKLGVHRQTHKLNQLWHSKVVLPVAKRHHGGSC